MANIGMRSVLCLVLSAAARLALATEPCSVIYGRATSYPGNGLLEIWHVGTHHTFYVIDQKSSQMILRYLPYLGGDRYQSLFADFTICPTENYREGASQPIIVKRIEHSRVVDR